MRRCVGCQQAPPGGRGCWGTWCACVRVCGVLLQELCACAQQLLRLHTSPYVFCVPPHRFLLTPPVHPTLPPGVPQEPVRPAPQLHRAHPAVSLPVQDQPEVRLAEGGRGGDDGGEGLRGGEGDTCALHVCQEICGAVGVWCACALLPPAKFLSNSNCNTPVCLVLTPSPPPLPSPPGMLRLTLPSSASGWTSVTAGVRAVQCPHSPSPASQHTGRAPCRWVQPGGAVCGVCVAPLCVCVN